MENDYRVLWSLLVSAGAYNETPVASPGFLIKGAGEREESAAASRHHAQTVFAKSTSTLFLQ